MGDERVKKLRGSLGGMSVLGPIPVENLGLIACTLPMAS